MSAATGDKIPSIRILSLGAGVQSTTMALMAAHGEFDHMPDAAIFADTGWEPRAVYDHLDWLCSPNVLPFPVHRISQGNIREDLLSAPPGAFSKIPFYTENGIGRRQCTREYKLSPVRDQAKAILNWPERKRIPPGAIECWIGISTDEASRMKPARMQYITNTWPLIDKRMSRGDCLRWLDRHDYSTPAKSSCIGCPFHNDHHWRDMRDNQPEEWADAVRLDHHIRNGGTARGERQYMHPSRVPLDQVDLSTLEDHGQFNMFNNECEGMCGV